MHSFEIDVAAGDLPEFTWIDPAYFDMPEDGHPATDQHPSHDISQGEMVIKSVYEALRNSPLWNESALLITYDEHGGFYSKVPPPNTGVPSPDGIPCVECPGGPMESFNFTRLGVRVPAIVVSPWVEKGQVIHEPSPVDAPTETSRYELSSIPATVKNMFSIPNFLNNRDAWATPFNHVWENNTLTEPRTDCPQTLPEPYVVDPSMRITQPLPLNGGLVEGEGMASREMLTSKQKPISDLHRELLLLVEGMVAAHDNKEEIQAAIAMQQDQANGARVMMKNEEEVHVKAYKLLKDAGALENEYDAGKYAMKRIHELYASLGLKLE
jgi:hypothetical protein